MEETKKSKEDTELLSFLELMDSVQPELTNLQKMDLLIKWKKKYRGLKGISLTVNPFTKNTNEEIAHDFLMMEKAVAEGKYKDMTESEVL